MPLLARWNGLECGRGKIRGGPRPGWLASVYKGPKAYREDPANEIGHLG